jgi:uncharacterized protein with von Willebrand factor type A (vWA) domain
MVVLMITVPQSPQVSIGLVNKENEFRENLPSKIDEDGAMASSNQGITHQLDKLQPATWDAKQIQLGGQIPQLVKAEVKSLEIP